MWMLGLRLTQTCHEAVMQGSVIFPIFWRALLVLMARLQTCHELRTCHAFMHGMQTCHELRKEFLMFWRGLLVLIARCHRWCLWPTFG